MERDCDNILIDQGYVFNGTREQFGEYFDNERGDTRIMEFCFEKGFKLSIKGNRVFLKDEQDKIKAKHPSICYDCQNSREQASSDNVEEGYTGCVAYCRDEDHTIVGECKDLGEGWVDLKTAVFGNRSGVISNCMLITKGVEDCAMFQSENKL